MPANTADPRVNRTRQLILQSFMELVEEKKNIYSISVQDIAARATINRATFYAHFEDKFAFLEYWMRVKFQLMIKRELPNGSITGMSSLRSFIQAVFDFLANFRLYMANPGNNQFEPLFEVAMQKELYQLLLEWLRSEASASVSEETVEATALVVSWGIFGAAVQWSRDPQRRAAEAAVQNVLVVVAASLAPVMGE